MVTSGGGSMIMIRKRYKIAGLVEERWSSGCISGEEEKPC
jgi:hypothetical protein